MTPLNPFRRAPASTIQVAVSTDRAYLPHAAAMVHSLVENGGKPLHLHLVAGDDVGNDLAGLIGDVCSAADAGFTLHRVDAERRAGLPSAVPGSQWDRLFLPELLPELDRVLFCDVDLLVCDSLRELWERDLEGNAVGAVTVVFPFEEWAQRHCAALGLASPREYFAAGVMLLDLAAWRELGLTERLIELARANEDETRAAIDDADAAAVIAHVAANPERWVFYDQDALNAELADRRLVLEPRWNAMNQIHALPGEDVHGESEARAARERPAIRHFEGYGGAKPWDPRAPEADRSWYWRHRNATAWGIGSELPHPMQEFFAGLREQRRQRSPGGREGARSRAIITIVQDEPVMLPIWLRHYGRYFAAGDIYVLDHQTSDGSTDGEGFVRVPVEHDRVDHAWMVETIADLQHQLLDSYETVVVTDVDELIAPDPALGTLGDYLDRLDEEFVNCLGYELMQLPDEQALDIEAPILRQRGWWFANDGYDKPAIATVPMSWVPGFHTRTDRRMNLDPDLRLIHLHRVDYELCRRRHELRATRDWNRDDVDSGWATHNRITEGDAFERWFYDDSSFDRRSIRIGLEPIPPAWREVL